MTKIINNTHVRKVLDHPKTKKYVNKKTIIYFTVIKLFIYALTAGILAFNAVDAKASNLEGTASEIIQIPVSYNTQLESGSTDNEVLHFRLIATNKTVNLKKLSISTISVFNESSLDGLALVINDGNSAITAKSKNGQVVYDFGKNPIRVAANDSIDLYFYANIKNMDVTYGKMQFKLKAESIVSDSKIAGDFPFASANYRLKNYDSSAYRTSRKPKTISSANSVVKTSTVKPASTNSAGGMSTSNSNSVLSWPAYTKQVNYKFQDTNYPFRNIAEHDGLDIGTTQGSKVLAAADGTIVELSNNYNTNYNFVVIRHSGGLATLYGHLSRIDVKLGDSVVRGQLIALSGGAPGTVGAGKYTSGAHLHFGVTKNGAYVDPQAYLK